MPYNGQPGNGTCRLLSSCNVTGTTDSSDRLSRYRTDTVTFTKSGTTYSYSQENVASFVLAHLNAAESGNYSVLAETAVFKTDDGGVDAFRYFYAEKKSASKIVLREIQSGSNSFNMLVLAKQSQPPAPPTSLSATAIGTAVTLTWVDQSTDETGFKVQTKTEVDGTWTTLETAAADAQSSTVTGVTGNNWYRVLATNANGDSITSNEILAEVE